MGVSAGALAALTITVVAWASAFAGIRASLTYYSPGQVALLRYTVASLTLGIYAVATKMPLPQRRDLPGLALLGLVGISFYNVALGFGQVTIPAATASFLVASVPVWIAIFASVVMQERLGRWGWLGALLSFMGVAVIAQGTRTGLHLDWRALVILAAALAQSVYSLGQKRYLGRYSALQVTAFAIWSGALFLLPFGSGLVNAVRTAPTGATAAVVYLGVIPGALGYVAWAYGLSQVPASVAGTYLYLVPAFALAIAWFWLGEVPTLVSVVGGLLVTAGVAVVNSFGRMNGPRSPAVQEESVGAGTNRRN